jgi:HAD superfamily hydrolase (TIGR01509 family)
MDDSNFIALSRLSEGDYQAFLYDCDGTLADNMPSHTLSYLEVAEENKVTFNPDMIDELAGWPIASVVEEINRRYHSNLDPEAFRKRKAEIFMNKFVEDAKPIDFVVEHLKANAGRVKIAVVSGGDRHTVERTLEVIGVRHLVEVLVCSGDTEKGKPFADPFLKAAAMLNVDPSKCLVFEDGIPGVKAAEAAKMHWIRIDQLKFG